MADAQISIKKDIYRRVHRLSDNKATQVLAFIDSLEEHEPNEETIRIIEDVEAGRNLIGPFLNMEDFKASLLSGDDA